MHRLVSNASGSYSSDITTRHKVSMSQQTVQKCTEKHEPWRCSGGQRHVFEYQNTIFGVQLQLGITKVHLILLI